MNDRTAALLEQIRQGKAVQEDIDRFTHELKQAIRTDPSKGKEFGQYIATVGTAFRSQPVQLNMNWKPVGGGHLAIGHKPGGKFPFNAMKSSGTSAILTLLQENEEAAKIGSGTTNAGMEWIWFPFSASRPHEGDALAEVFDLYATLQQRLAGGHKIYIHCSAGIHRTGMVTYGLLRYLGQDSATARQTLLTLREVTADQVGEPRLAWGEQFARG